MMWLSIPGGESAQWKKRGCRLGRVETSVLLSTETGPMSPLVGIIHIWSSAARAQGLAMGATMTRRDIGAQDLLCSRHGGRESMLLLC